MVNYIPGRNERTDERKQRNKERDSGPMRDLLNDLDKAKEEVMAAADQVPSAPKEAPAADGKS